MDDMNNGGNDEEFGLRIRVQPHPHHQGLSVCRKRCVKAALGIYNRGNSEQP